MIALFPLWGSFIP